MGVKLVLPLCLESHLFCDRGLRVFPPYAKTSHICQFSSRQCSAFELEREWQE